MGQQTPPQPDTGSLDLVADEMRHREAAQDAQATILMNKASYLFSAGTAGLGAAAAVAGFVVSEGGLDQGHALRPGLAAATAYGCLFVSFVLAYWVRQFNRVPNPKRLMDYLDLNPEDAKRKIASGRRWAVETNARTLRLQAQWVNRALAALVIETGAIIATLVTLTLE